MDRSARAKSMVQPKTVTERLPNLNGMISKDAAQTSSRKCKPTKTMPVKKDLTVRSKTLDEIKAEIYGMLSKDPAQTVRSTKKSRPLTAMSASKGSNVKLKTLAEIKADILAIQLQSPNWYGQPIKKWNSSVKVDHKMTNHTGGDKQKHSSVRKVLNFQAKPKAQVLSAVTPKFTKPEPKAKKTLIPVQGKSGNIRISGVFAIPPTPQNNTNSPTRRITKFNKENVPQIANYDRKSLAPSKIALNNVLKKHQPVIPDTPLSNISSDASFLQREKEINDENLTVTEPTLENIADFSPPMSTPFKNYRSVHECFMNDSTTMDISVLQVDNTVALFDKPSAPEAKDDDSVIFSLCDLLNKATVTNNDPIQMNECRELNELLDMEKQALNSIVHIKNVINIMNNVRENHEAYLKNIRKLIQNKRDLAMKALEVEEKEGDRTLTIEEIQVSVKTETTITSEGARNYSSVIRCTRSPTYRIPRKNSCLRKKLHKSVPNSLNVVTPEQNLKNSNRAISMYLNIKENMNFLNTPVSKQWPNVEAADTPAITSRNLQIQLDKLYGGS